MQSSRAASLREWPRASPAALLVPLEVPCAQARREGMATTNEEGLEVRVGAVYRVRAALSFPSHTCRPRSRGSTSRPALR